MDFNLNQYVRVKLTDFGKEKLEDKKLQILTEYPLLKGENIRVLPEEDEEGWSKWQLHVLMRELGDFVSNGAPLPFETTIKIGGGEEFPEQNSGEPTEQQIEQIADMVATQFRVFGGGKKSSWGNPVTAAFEGRSPVFAAGVDVKEVVRLVLELANK